MIVPKRLTDNTPAQVQSMARRWLIKLQPVIGTDVEFPTTCGITWPELVNHLYTDRIFNELGQYHSYRCTGLLFQSPGHYRRDINHMKNKGFQINSAPTGLMHALLKDTRAQSHPQCVKRLNISQSSDDFVKYRSSKVNNPTHGGCQYETQTSTKF